MIKILTYKVSEGNLSRNGGCVNQSLIEEAEEGVNKVVQALKDKDYQITDLKVNHFTAHRHNNGGCDEVWAQFTVMYQRALILHMKESEITNEVDNKLIRLEKRLKGE